ncbi:MAG: NUDIX domain-containing protein [Parcubacteria group bacterium]
MNEHLIKKAFEAGKSPKVGIGILIFKDGKILLGRRKNDHGVGEYQVPGGDLDYMESFEECAKRETMEETGLKIKNIRFLDLQNLKTYAPKHYVDIGLIADWENGEPKVLEPELCDGWNWYDLNNLPKPLFDALSADIEALKTGQQFFDA